MKRAFNWLVALAVFVSIQVQAQETAETNIWAASATGDLERIKKLVEEDGVDVDLLEPNIGATALTFATISAQVESAKLLIDLGANVNDPGMSGNTALHAATFVGAAEIAKVLMEAGADVTQANYEGSSPADNLQIDWATTEYIASMLQLTLVEADVMAGRQKISSMIEAAMLARAKDDIWLAVIMNQPDLVKEHIAGGANVDQTAEDGTPLLVLAIAMASAETVKMLIDAGANVNATNVTHGGTPLIAAGFLGKADAAKLLLAAGADASIADYQGSTVREMLAMDWATTEYIASMIGVTLNQDELLAARQQIREMLPPPESATETE